VEEGADPAGDLEITRQRLGGEDEHVPTSLYVDLVDRPGSQMRPDQIAAA